MSNIYSYKYMVSVCNSFMSNLVYFGGTHCVYSERGPLSQTERWDQFRSRKTRSLNTLCHARQWGQSMCTVFVDYSHISIAGDKHFIVDKYGILLVAMTNNAENPLAARLFVRSSNVKVSLHPFDTKCYFNYGHTFELISHHSEI